MRSIVSINIWPDDVEGSPLYEPLFDSLADHVGVLSEAEAAQISSYMDIFSDSGGWLSHPVDPIDRETIVKVDGGEDDKYRWSGMLRYLVERYRVDPPMEFRQHVKDRFASGLDLQTLADEVNCPQGRYSARTLRERHWRKLKAEGGVAAAWVLYP